jgi:16S rRNA U1498 N3-methylase RsmE
MRGDTATHRRLMDSLMVAAHGGPSQCGERPTTAYAALRRLDQAGEHVAGVAADAGRFTVRQFAILRERIAPWVLSNGAEGGLTPDERRVLEARRAELARHGELLRA